MISLIHSHKPNNPDSPDHVGYLPGKRGLDGGSVMEGIGALGAGLIDIEDMYKLECNALPGTGSCSAMFTACTMASIIESLGMSPSGAFV